MNKKRQQNVNFFSLSHCVSNQPEWDIIVFQTFNIAWMFSLFRPDGSNNHFTLFQMCYDSIDASYMRETNKRLNLQVNTLWIIWRQQQHSKHSEKNLVLDFGLCCKKNLSNSPLVLTFTFNSIQGKNNRDNFILNKKNNWKLNIKTF